MVEQSSKETNGRDGMRKSAQSSIEVHFIIIVLGVSKKCVCVCILWVCFVLLLFRRYFDVMVFVCFCFNFLNKIFLCLFLGARKKEEVLGWGDEDAFQVNGSLWSKISGKEDLPLSMKHTRHYNGSMRFGVTLIPTCITM